MCEMLEAVPHWNSSLVKLLLTFAVASGLYIIKCTLLECLHCGCGRKRVTKGLELE